MTVMGDWEWNRKERGTGNSRYGGGEEIRKKTVTKAQHDVSGVEMRALEGWCWFLQ